VLLALWWLAVVMLGCCQPARGRCGEREAGGGGGGSESSAPGDDENRKGRLVGAWWVVATRNRNRQRMRELTGTHENFFFGPCFVLFLPLRRGRVAADGVEVNTEVNQTRRRAGTNGGEMTAEA
jgi:hypothetical protein